MTRMDVRQRGWDWHVAAILLVGLGLRLALWWWLPYRDWISDEGEYWGAATWLAQGRDFSFFDRWIWTRPPVYLLFLAVHIRIFGPTALWAPRLTQALLSTLLVYLVMLLARRLAPASTERRVALLSGWAMAVSYSFATFAYLLLSETVFLTLFVGALLALLHWATNAGSRSRWMWLVVASGLLGLCALTRAVILTWLPFVAVWVGLTVIGRERIQGRIRAVVARHWRVSLSAVVLLTVVVSAVVLPWSAYATARWGHGEGIVLVDTTGGYNFALGAQTGRFGKRSETTLHDTLCGSKQCDNQHVARQQKAYELGRTWIAEAPGGFVKKTMLELLDMIQLRYGGAERLSSGYTSGDVPLAHLLGLVLDDTLYLVAAVLAPFGLLRQQERQGKGLIGSWLVYNIVIGALFFAINRFRQPLLPFIYIYAACALVQPSSAWQSMWRRRSAWTLSLLLLLLILPSYLYWPPVFDPNRRAVLHETFLGIRGLRYAAECAMIEATLEEGQVARARQLHNAADARTKRECLALINARLLEQEGKIEGPDGALTFLERSAPPNNVEQQAKILMLEGDLLRRIGRLDDARGRFAYRAVEIRNLLSWAWNMLRLPPNTVIDLGNGVDIGYIEGFYKREFPQDSNDPFGEGYRWSGPQARLRFVNAGTGQPQLLTLRVNGYTTNPYPTRITPRLGEVILEPIEVQPDWQEISIPLPATPPGEDVIVDFDSTVFVPGPEDLAENVRSSVRQPLRLLGVQVDWAKLAHQ